jgi:hypothetical protein
VQFGKVSDMTPLVTRENYRLHETDFQYYFRFLLYSANTALLAPKHGKINVLVIPRYVQFEKVFDMIPLVPLRVLPTPIN